jgi:membrane protease YdiL (CAAX protease family)
MLLGAVVGCFRIVLAYVVLPGLAAADPRQLKWSILASTAVYNASTLLGGPLGEEPGWRGFVLPRLQIRFGPVKGSLVVAACWVGWHLPLFLVRDWTNSPLWVYVLLLSGVSVIMTYGVNLARFSVIAAIAMHAAFNTVSRFLNGLFAGTEPRLQISPVLLIALTGLAVAVALIVVTRGRLAYQLCPDRSGQQEFVQCSAERPNPPLQPTAGKRGV